MQSLVSLCLYPMCVLLPKNKYSCYKLQLFFFRAQRTFARRPLHSLTLRVYVPSVHSSLTSRAPFAALPATSTSGRFVVSLIYQPAVPLLRALNRASTCTRYFKIALTHIRSSFHQFVANISRLQCHQHSCSLVWYTCVPHLESPTLASMLTNMYTNRCSKTPRLWMSTT